MRYFFYALCAALSWVYGVSAIAAEVDGILVKYRDSGHFAAAGERAIGHGVFVLPANAGKNLSGQRAAASTVDLLAALRTDPAVLYAEPNHFGHFADMPGPAVIPNDPEFVSQGWLEKVGARQAWSVATGKGLTVAVVDSGVDLSHPDLRTNLRSDGFSTGDNNSNAQDLLGHGTFVAGIIAAQRGNSVAGSGLAPDAKILPVKVTSKGAASFTSAALAQGIDYATTHGARVINLSLFVDNATQTVSDAIQRALDAGAVVVVAAGNDGGAVSFPATYPGVIAVAGSNADDTLSSLSNRGIEVVVAAPAIGVKSTLLGGSFGMNGSGTSYSAPMLSAAIADLLQIDGRLSRKTIVEIIRSTAKTLIGDSEEGSSFGVLDAGAACLSLLPDVTMTNHRLTQADILHVGYRLPKIVGTADVYLALDTPLGEFLLRSDASWVEVASSGYLPLVTAYQSDVSIEGNLFGSAPPWQAIPLSGVPAGKYAFKVALVNSKEGKLIGVPVITSFVLSEN